jgi:hypothetical protein
LYFCDLNAYRHQSFVDIQFDPKEKVDNLFVLLPVFIDPITNGYSIPKDYTMATSSQLQSRLSHPNLPYAMDQSCRMDTASPSSSVMLADNKVPCNQKQDRFELPLWELNRNFKSVHNTDNMDYLSSERLVRASTPSSPLSLDRPISMLQDISALEPSPLPQRAAIYKPTLCLNKPKARNVLHSVYEKSAASSDTIPRPSLSFMNRYMINHINAFLSNLST